MKYMMFSDIHKILGISKNHKNSTKLENAILAEKPDVLMILGDLDQLATVRKIKEIEEQFLKDGKVVLKVPGNHDYAIFHNQAISSSALKSRGKSSYDLHRELVSDKQAYEYMRNLVNSDFFVRGFLDKEKFKEKYPFVIVHGGYSGSLRDYPGCPEKLAPLWYRMDENFSLNFKEMIARGEKIMIRGHDHFPAYLAKTKWGEESYIAMGGNKFALSNEKEHIINPGALLYNHFAIIDTSEKVPVLEFKNM